MLCSHLFILFILCLLCLLTLGIKYHCHLCGFVLKSTELCLCDLDSDVLMFAERGRVAFNSKVKLCAGSFELFGC